MNNNQQQTNEARGPDCVGHESEDTHYVCYRTPFPIMIDGDLNKTVWQHARKSPRFVDMISGTPGFLDTCAAALWDEEALYIAFWIEEPFVEAKLTQRDASTFWRGTHPRGLRWAFTDWDFPGLRTAVQVQGTLNDNTDIDRGWTVEIAFPWTGMKHLAEGRSLPPQEGDIWRIFFGRFGKFKVGNTIVGNAMSWNLIGDIDNHLPERFTNVLFSTQTTPDK